MDQKEETQQAIAQEIREVRQRAENDLDRSTLRVVVTLALWFAEVVLSEQNDRQWNSEKDDE